MKLKEQARQKQQRQKKKHKQLQFNHEITNVSLQNFSNRITRSLKTKIQKEKDLSLCKELR